MANRDAQLQLAADVARYDAASQVRYHFASRATPLKLGPLDGGNWMPESKDLLQILAEIRSLLASATESDWAALTPEEVITILDREIASLRTTDRACDVVELRSLFAPTGEIQEISMANGWSKRYIELSSRFDVAMHPFSE